VTTWHFIKVSIQTSSDEELKVFKSYREITDRKIIVTWQAAMGISELLQ
jgi:hypothetical protein